jgi:hypothetical protein
MGKKSKSKQNKSKKANKPVVNKIDNDEASLDDVETSVIEEVTTMETQVAEENSSDEPKVSDSEWMTEYNSLLTLREDEKKLRSDREEYLKEFMKEHEKKMKEFSSILKKNKREQDNSIKKMKKLHTNEVKKASKEKRKRNGKATGGFTTQTEVPKKLREWLGLEDDVMMTRPAVFSLMSEKFKEEGLKSGQEIILDKKNSKKLGKPDKYKILFSKQQTFLAGFYNEEKQAKQEVDV